MHENVTTAHMVALSCLRPSRRAPAHRLLGDGFPVDDLSVSRAAGARASSCAIVPAEDDLTVQHRSRCSTRSTRRPRSSPSRTCCSAPRTSWMRRRSSRRAHEVGATVILDTYQSAGIIPVDVARARRRLRGRRLPEMAVRRPGQRVSLHAARSAEARAAVVHRLAVARSIRSTSTSSDDRHAHRETMRCG